MGSTPTLPLVELLHVPGRHEFIHTRSDPASSRALVKPRLISPGFHARLTKFSFCEFRHNPLAASSQYSVAGMSMPRRWPVAGAHDAATKRYGHPDLLSPLFIAPAQLRKAERLAEYKHSTPRVRQRTAGEAVCFPVSIIMEKICTT